MHFVLVPFIIYLKLKRRSCLKYYNYILLQFYILHDDMNKHTKKKYQVSVYAVFE